MKTDQATDGLLLATPTYGDYSSNTTYMAILDKNGVPRFHRLLTDTNFWASDFVPTAPPATRLPGGRPTISRILWQLANRPAQCAVEVTSTVGTVALHTDGHDFQIASDGA